MFDTVMLGKRIREARIKVKLTQEQLSEKAGITLYYLGEIERGVKSPSLKIFVSIAEALGVSTDFLLCDSIKNRNFYLNNEIMDKLNTLMPHERAVILDILESYIKAIQ